MAEQTGPVYYEIRVRGLLGRTPESVNLNGAPLLVSY